MPQLIEIITDASLLCYISEIKQPKPEVDKELKLGIGAGICRLKAQDIASQNEITKQILRGVFLFDCTQSFDAELLCGLKVLEQVNKSIGLKDNSINWICDLSYINPLFNDPNKIQNQTLKSIINEIKEITKESKLQIIYPEKSSDKKYHDYCHRICTEVRENILKNSNLFPEYSNIAELTSEVFKKHSNWKLI